MIIMVVMGGVSTLGISHSLYSGLVVYFTRPKMADVALFFVCCYFLVSVFGLFIFKLLLNYHFELKQSVEKKVFGNLLLCAVLFFIYLYYSEKSLYWFWRCGKFYYECMYP